MMTMQPRRIVFTLCLLALLYGCCTGAACKGKSKLHHFVKSAKHHSAHGHRTHYVTRSTDAQPVVIPGGHHGGWQLFGSGGGEPLPSFVRFDVAARRVDDDIHAVDMRAGAGLGPIGLEYNESRYQERDPTDSLTIKEGFALYRMPWSSSCEVDFGLGAMMLDGDSQKITKAAVTLPILWHPQHAHLGAELRPAYADRVGDYDFALLYSWRVASLKAGYRWVVSPDCSLSGPYLGMSVHYEFKQKQPPAVIMPDTGANVEKPLPAN